MKNNENTLNVCIGFSSPKQKYYKYIFHSVLFYFLHILLTSFDFAIKSFHFLNFLSFIYFIIFYLFIYLFITYLYSFIIYFLISFSYFLRFVDVSTEAMFSKYYH